MKIRHLLYKLKIELKEIYTYPRLHHSQIDYERYWTKRGNKLNAFQKDRARIVENNIKNHSTVVDIASGTGNILKYLIINKKIKAIAFEISETCLKNLQKEGIENYSVDLNKQSDLEKLPNANHYLAFEILEHLPNSELVLTTLVKKSTKSLFISVPNSGYYTHRLRLFLGRFPIQWRTHPSEHIRFWTKQDMEWWLEELNLYSRSKLYFYQGIPVLNKIFSGIFARGILVKITTQDESL